MSGPHDGGFCGGWRAKRDGRHTILVQQVCTSPDNILSQVAKFEAGPERDLLPPGERYFETQRVLDSWQRVAWIQSLAPWDVMATFTFRWESSVWAAMRAFKKTMAKRLPGVSYYAVTERNPSRDGYHLHSLWADCSSVNRNAEWQYWFNKYGRARIEPVRKQADVASYASKYLSKEESHLEILLRSHHRDRIHGITFQLDSTVVEL